MENELYHHGRKGMKWYQNIFSKDKKKGSGKRSGDDDDEPKKDGPSEHYSRARKPSAGMSDDDLRVAIQRLQNEKTYRQLYNELNPQKVSKTKEFLSNVMNKTVTPALMDAGKRVLTDYAIDTASKALGLKKEKVKTSLDALREEVDELQLKKKKSEIEKYFQRQRSGNP